MDPAKFIGMISGIAVDSAMNPLHRAALYAANWTLPNALPSVSDFFDTYAKGLQSRQGMILGCQVGGVSIPTAPDHGLEFTWSGTKLVYTGQPAFTNRHIWHASAEAQVRLPAPGELLVMMNRGLVDVPTAQTILRRQGFANAGVQLALLELRHEIPGPSDQVMFALKEVWDQQIVQKYQYPAEMPGEFRFWLAQHGYDQDLRTAAQVAAGVAPYTWADAYWWAHWNHISPGQAYEMFHKLRPGRLARYQVGGLNPGAFLLTDVQAVLKIADYPVPFRDQLAAINFVSLTRVDVRRLRDRDIIDDTEVFELYLDRGYTPVDAQRMTDWGAAEKKLKDWKATQAYTKAQICNLYKAGAIGSKESAQLLYPLFLTKIADIEAYLAQANVLQIAQAQADARVRAFLLRCDLEVRVKLFTKSLAAVRRRILCGRLGRIPAQQELGALGVAANRIDDYVDTWIMERDHMCRDASVGKILEGFRYGYLTANDARNRLLQMGYSEDDILLLLSLVGRNQALDLARAQAAAARTVAQRARASAQLQRELQRQKRQAQIELARHGSPAQLARWHRKNLITHADAVARLAVLGWPVPDADRMLADAQACTPRCTNVGVPSGS